VTRLSNNRNLRYLNIIITQTKSQKKLLILQIVV